MGLPAKSEGWPRDPHQALLALGSACARVTESCLILCAHGQLWEAEILCRSVSEGTLKWCYLLVDRPGFDSRAQEYAKAAFEIGLLKDHHKLVAVLAALGSHIEGVQALADRLLSDQELAEFTKLYPREVRGAVERRWGFVNMVETMIREGRGNLVEWKGLLHGYSSASHVAHMDFQGVILPVEREQRPEPRGRLLHLAHLARLLTDMLTFLKMRLVAAFHFAGCDPKPLVSAFEQQAAFQAELKPFHAEWMAMEYP